MGLTIVKSSEKFSPEKYSKLSVKSVYDKCEICKPFSFCLFKAILILSIPWMTGVLLKLEFKCRWCRI